MDEPVYNICGATALGDHKKWICNLEPHRHEHHRWVWDLRELKLKEEIMDVSKLIDSITAELKDPSDYKAIPFRDMTHQESLLARAAAEANVKRCESYNTGLKLAIIRIKQWAEEERSKDDGTNVEDSTGALLKSMSEGDIIYRQSED